MSLTMLWSSSEGILEAIVTRNWQSLQVSKHRLNMIVTSIITTMPMTMVTRFLNLGLVILLLLVSFSLKFRKAD